MIDELMELADAYANYSRYAHTPNLPDDARAALRAALEAALKPGEPVAKYIGECTMGSLVQLYDDLKKDTYLYRAAPPAQTLPHSKFDDE